MWLIIPVKKINDAKYRLKSLLNPIQREQLFLAMLEDVLSVVKSIPELENISLATICPTAIKIAKKYGASILDTYRDEGQTEAIKKSAEALDNNGIKNMILLPADIPLVTETEISKVIEVHNRSPMMTIVPARDEKGSNCIALSPPTAIPLSFGPNSYFPHIHAARNSELKLKTISLPGIGLDIDTPSDLKELCKKPISTRTQKFLNDQKIVEKIIKIE